MGCQNAWADFLKLLWTPVLADLRYQPFHLKLAKSSTFCIFSTLKSIRLLATKVFIFDIFDGKWMKTGHLNHKKVILRKKNENLAQNWAKIGRNRIFDGRTYLLTCINGQKLSGTWFFLSFTEFLYTIEIIIPFLLVWGHSRDGFLGKHAHFGSKFAKFA